MQPTNNQFAKQHLSVAGVEIDAPAKVCRWNQSKGKLRIKDAEGEEAWGKGGHAHSKALKMC